MNLTARRTVCWFHSYPCVGCSLATWLPYLVVVKEADNGIGTVLQEMIKIMARLVAS